MEWNWTPRVAVSALATLTAGASAAAPKVVTEIVKRKVEVPRSLLTCSPEPVERTAWISQCDDARYMIDLAEAREDCRTKLDAVLRLVKAAD
ncbi:MAG: hypothetical protein ACT6QU_19120 [Aliihoeflea sp.]|uniref:hypothetical protein n=1 Tax=Aliihoeflea sp. TaxID=2608088 RepID=UPI004034BFFA